jgi:N-acetylmuramate 1-kinase
MIPDEYSGLAALARRTGHDPVSVEILPGDVGRRRYLRLTLAGGRTVLGVVYCAEEADSRRRWVEAHAALKQHVRVPSLVADDEAGNHIVEDLGRTDLATLLLDQTADRPAWLSRAAAAAAILAGLPDPGINPPFDAAFFRRELDLAREAVFDMFLRAPLSPGERSSHDAWAHALSREIEAHPRALCHRDYHGNNLFPVGDGVGWIDFQDLRAGPDSYDPASLLWERTTLEWMTEDLAGPVIGSFARARGLDAAEFRPRFDRVLLQRAWKVCGTFARAVAQGRGEAYRRYLPAEIALVGRLLGNSSEEREFRRVFENRLAALC